MKKQHQFILKRAQEMGIAVKDISKMMGEDAALLKKEDQETLIIRGTPNALINLRSQSYCDHKQLTKEAFNALDIPCPSSIVFRTKNDPAIPAFFQVGKTYVCKPVDGSNGVAVRMHIKALEEVYAYWDAHQEMAGAFLLEEQIQGTDLRVQVIDSKIVAACTRVPAYVVGDGLHSIRQLAEQLRAKTKAQNEANDLLLDEASLALLSEQGFSLEAVAEVGQEVRLKKVANMAQGAIAIDLTDELHPVFQSWIDRLCAYLDLGYFAIDIMAVDHRRAPSDDAWALEINARPEWLHHTFSSGRQHDIPGLLLRCLFAVDSS